MWLRQAGIPTKADYILINRILNIHRDWTILFKQQSKTIQQELDKSKAFIKDLAKTFWAPIANCKWELNDKTKQFLNNMRGIREGEVFSVDRVTMDKNKSKLEKVLKVQKRRYNETQRKMDSELSFLVEQSQDSKIS